MRTLRGCPSHRRRSLCGIPPLRPGARYGHNKPRDSFGTFEKNAYICF